MTARARKPVEAVPEPAEASLETVPVPVVSDDLDTAYEAYKAASRAADEALTRFLDAETGSLRVTRRELSEIGAARFRGEFEAVRAEVYEDLPTL